MDQRQAIAGLFDRAADTYDPGHRAARADCLGRRRRGRLSRNRHEAARLTTWGRGRLGVVWSAKIEPAGAGGVREDGCDSAGRPRIAVSGRLDGQEAGQLVEACRQMLRRSPHGLALDLTGLTGAGPEGVRAVAECLAAGRELSAGVDIAVASPAGRRLLLATLAEV